MKVIGIHLGKMRVDMVTEEGFGVIIPKYIRQNAFKL